jgi:hypothetical protein
LPVLKDFAASQSITAPADFLDPDYFTRLDVYFQRLKEVNIVSKLFQSQSFPTSHLVIVVYAACKAI